MSALFNLGKKPKRDDSVRPVVTYRHVLTPQAMTVMNPLRVIAHCDIDAAYAQFEMVRLGIAEDQPVCVQQWTGLIAVNYPARKFGITRHMDVHEAKKKCPHLQTIHVATYRDGETEPGYWGEGDPKHHKVSLDPYRRESTKILAVFKRLVGDVGEVGMSGFTVRKISFEPFAEVILGPRQEKASIDEAYLDLTGLAMQEILNRLPHIGSLPEDAPFGLDTPLPPPPPITWDPLSNIFPLRGDSGTTAAEDGDGYDGLADEEAAGGWEDYALSVGAEIMGRIRAEVKRELGYTCSAGVAHNKTIAKLCSAWKKPDAQTIMRQAAIPAFLNPMPFTKIRFLGGKLGDAMAKEYEANTVGDMLTVPLDEMQRKFGEESIWVYNILRGIDYNPVKERTATKSMLASKNVQPAVTSREGGYHWLGILAGELYVRLRDARDETEGLWPKTMVLSTRQVGEAVRSRQTAFPFTRQLSADYITKYANRLWDEVSEPMMRQINSKSSAMRINNLGLSFAGLDRLEGGQKGIEGFFKNGNAQSRGIKRDRSPSAGPGPSTERQTVKRNNSGPLKTSSPEIIELSDESDAEQSDQQTQAQPNFYCTRCSKTIRSGAKVHSDGQQSNEQIVEDIRREHNDYHVARDLYAEDMAGTRPSHGNSSKLKKANKVVKKQKPEGIRAFFSPKEDSARTSKPKDR